MQRPATTVLYCEVSTDNGVACPALEHCYDNMGLINMWMECEPLDSMSWDIHTVLMIVSERDYGSSVMPRSS